jgi:hypothetical protein
MATFFGGPQGSCVPSASAHATHTPSDVPQLSSCPGRKSPFLMVKRSARPYKSAMQNQFTTENAEAALNAFWAGPDGVVLAVREANEGRHAWPTGGAVNWMCPFADLR